MGVTALFLATAAICFAIAGYRIWLHTRGRRHHSDTPLLVISVALGSAFFFLAPAIQAVESALVDSLGRLLSNICTLIAAFGFLHLMLYVRYPIEQVSRRLRPRLAALLVSLTVMITMFAVSNPPSGTGVFSGLYHTQPTLAVYALVYALYLGSAVLDLAVLTARSVRHTRSWLRLGMLTNALGCLLAMSYIGGKFYGVLAEVITGTAPSGSCPSAFATWGCTLSVGMPALSVLAIIIGITLPALGPRAEFLVRALGRWRSYQRLAPLYTALHAELPHIDTASTAFPAGKDRRVSERLYQRVVAIRDGLLLLQPYRDPADTRHHHELATHLHGRRRAAAVEAADIRVALTRHHHGQTSSSDEPEPTRYDDLDSEIRWLIAVAAALDRNELRPSRTAMPITG